VREMAAKRLGGLSHISEVALAALRAALRDEDEWVRLAAARALMRHGSYSEALEELLALTKHPRVRVRIGALQALGEDGQPTSEVVGALLAALGDEDVSVRANAARSLGLLKVFSPEVVQALAMALCTDEDVVKMHAAEALGDIGIAADEVVEALVAALESPTWWVREQAAKALGKVKARAKKAIETRSDEAVWVVVNAAWALYVLGKEKEAKKVFRRLLQHDDHLVREEVLEKISLLLHWQDPDLVDILTEALKDESHFVVETAQRILRGGF